MWLATCAAVAGALGLTLAARGSAGAISPGAVSASAATAAPRAGATLPVPGIDPQFIYHQLAYMATHFQRREAGYPSSATAHDGFARYWTSEMLKLLGPFGASARRYPFKIARWVGRPGTAPAFNVSINVASVTHPAPTAV